MRTLRRPYAVVLGAASSFLYPTSFPLRRPYQPGGGGDGVFKKDDVVKILSQGLNSSTGDSVPLSNIFNGRFDGGSGTIEPGILQDMHRTLSQSLSPEVQDSMRAMMEGLQRGDGLPPMGMMAFGVGENERGKKVARAAKLTFDPNTLKVSKDFVEEQIEEDDPVLPKETVGDYHTEGAMEVEFEEDTRQHASKPSEKILETDVVFEETVSSSSSAGRGKE